MYILGVTLTKKINNCTLTRRYSKAMRELFKVICFNFVNISPLLSLGRCHAVARNITVVMTKQNESSFVFLFFSLQKQFLFIQSFVRLFLNKILVTASKRNFIFFLGNRFISLSFNKNEC